VKVISVFINVFSILVFLTLGSFFIIIALHIVSQDDALRAVNEIYSEPLRSLQAGLMGFLFIFVGLSFAKFLIKNTKGDDALVFHGENGTITVAVSAIEDLVRKVLRKFQSVKAVKIKTVIHEKNLSLRIKLTVYSGVLIPEVVREVQNEIKERLEKMLGVSEIAERTEILVSVQKVVASHNPQLETVSNY
jgi:uncharacterized alkaline shock family protein YloU